MTSRSAWNDRLSTLRNDPDFSGQDDLDQSQQSPKRQCRPCRGTGWDDEFDGEECLECLGEGEV
jgi:hypothetical protein